MILSKQKERPGALGVGKYTGFNMEQRYLLTQHIFNRDIKPVTRNGSGLPYKCGWLGLFQSHVSVAV